MLPRLRAVPSKADLSTGGVQLLLAAGHWALYPPLMLVIEKISMGCSGALHLALDAVSNARYADAHLLHVLHELIRVQLLIACILQRALLSVVQMSVLNNLVPQIASPHTIGSLHQE